MTTTITDQKEKQKIPYDVLFEYARKVEVPRGDAKTATEMIRHAISFYDDRLDVKRSK
jgi:hypothetical protein